MSIHGKLGRVNIPLPQMLADYRQKLRKVPHLGRPPLIGHPAEGRRSLIGRETFVATNGRQGPGADLIVLS